MLDGTYKPPVWKQSPADATAKAVVAQLKAALDALPNDTAA